MNILSKRQNELINVSLKLIANNGIQSLTIKNLAESVGISEPAIYRHFKNKAHLLMAILDSFDTSIEELISIVDSQDITFLEKLELFFIKRCEEFQTNPDISTALFSEEIFNSEVALVEKVYLLMKKNQQYISILIKKGQENDQINNEIPCEHLTIIVIGSLRLLVKRWRISNFSFNLVTEGRQLFVSIKKLITKEL